MHSHQVNKILHKPLSLLLSLLIIFTFCLNADARDLQRILYHGLQNDPGIREAEANERVAEGRLAQSEAAKWPTVTARANQPVVRSGDSGRQGFEPVLEDRQTGGSKAPLLSLKKCNPILHPILL